MAARSVTVAALRHRPRQAVLVVVLSAIVTAAAGLGPLYARAVEQSVLRTVVSGAPVSQSGIVVTATDSEPPSPAELARVVAAEAPPQFNRIVRGADTTVLVEAPDASEAGGGSIAYRGRLASRAGSCPHLEVAAGRCVQGPGEVMVSQRSARTAGLDVGSALLIRGEGDQPGRTGPDPLEAEVVGLYEAVDLDDPYWSGRGQTGTAATRAVDAEADLGTIDDVLTTWSTLSAHRWQQVSTHVDLQLDPDRVDLAAIDSIGAATKAVDRQAETVGGSATSQLAPLLASTASQRDQARTVIPLLMVQLAVLGIVVLAFVCAAATEQRRPEIALARLRGLGTMGAAGLLLRELGVLVLAGTALGAALGWLVGWIATERWLAPGVILEPTRWPVSVAVAASAVAGLLAIMAAAAPTLRQPLTSLLRRVPPRASNVQVGVVEGAIVAAAGAGVVTLLSGGGGPVALLAPGLLAIAGGLLLAQAAIPTAGPLVRRSLRRGRLTSALAGVQVARRPALRRLIAIVTVACALLVFAVDAWSVSGRNRDARADVDAGAPVVLTVGADSSFALHEAMRDIDPRGRFATPVVTIRSATDTGPVTTAVEPSAFARIARWGTESDRIVRNSLNAIRTEGIDPIRLRGDRVEATADFTARGLPPGPDQPVPELAPMRLVLGVVDADGILRRVDLGRPRAGTRTYAGDLPCQEGCVLREVSVTRTFGDFVDAQITVAMSRLRAGSAGALQPVDLDTTEEDAWQPAPWRPDAPITGAVRVGKALTFSDVSFGTTVTAQRGDQPVTPSALQAGDLPEMPADPNRRADLVLAPDLSAGDLAYEVIGNLTQVPRSGGRGLLVDLAAVAGGPTSAPARTSYDVWLAADDPAREQRLITELGRHGIAVSSRDTAAAHRQAFADEGPTLALRLAVVAGLVSVVLAASVLVVGVATSGASRARDLAGLRLVGVSAPTVRAAAVAEHLVVAVLGVIAGATLGMVAAQAALPSIPLFATASAHLPLVLDPVWPAVLVTVAGCLVLLCVVSVVVGRALAAAATPDRLREGR